MIGTSRIRSPTAPVSIPSPVERERREQHEQRRRRAPADHGMRNPSSSAPPMKPVDAVTAALTSTGSGAAEEERHPVRRSREHRRERLRPALAVDREASRTAQPARPTDRVADDEPRVRLEVGRAAEVGEEDDLGRRAEQQRRDVDRRADPREERAVADRAADEEDAEPGPHVSERVARSRASRSKWCRQRARRSRCTRCSARGRRGAACRRHRRSPTAAPRSCPRSARAPRRSGCTQPGSSESGISIPVIVQIGYSSACESELAAR